MKFTRSTQNCFRGCISAKLWSIDKKLGTLHRHHEIRIYAKVGNSATYGCWDNKKCTILLITLESIVQIVLFLYHLIPWDMRFWQCLICQFPWMVLSAILKVNEKLFFRYSSFKVLSILSKSNHRSLDRPAQKWLNRFLIFATVPEKYLSEVDRTRVRCLMLVILAFY